MATLTEHIAEVEFLDNAKKVEEYLVKMLERKQKIEDHKGTTKMSRTEKQKDFKTTIERFFTKKLKTFLSIINIEYVPDYTLNIEIVGEGLTMDNLIKLSEITNSKKINISSETYSPSSLICDCKGYCYCSSFTAPIFLSVVVDAKKIEEIRQNKKLNK
jgi:hypothetical protein